MILMNRQKHMRPPLGIGDAMQVLGDELGMISIASIRAARYINQAAEQAKNNNCGDCFTLHVVAHSQGTSVFRAALPLIKPEYKSHIRFTGLGGQRFANSFWGLGGYENYANYDDAVPWISNVLNPLRSLEGTYIAIFDPNTQFRYKGGAMGVGAHPWEKNYYDWLQ